MKIVIREHVLIQQSGALIQLCKAAISGLLDNYILQIDEEAFYNCNWMANFDDIGLNNVAPPIIRMRGA